jgi:peptide/nickel transport system substrate-binding protein
VDNRKIDYRILGSFEVWVGDRLVGLGGEKPRALLAILLLHHDEVVSADRLIDDLWGASPPETAMRTLQTYVWRLRKALDTNGASGSEEPESGPGANGRVLLTRERGYLLEVAPGELDLERFWELTERGRDALAARRPEAAAALLSEALGMWRGPPLAEFAYEPFAQGAIAQLEELHLAAIEDRVEADLDLGRARELVGELRDLVARHPLRERLRGQLMLALYRSGRQAEALAAHQELRRSLSEELGLEPGPAIQRLELSILSRDPALDLPRSDAAAEAGETVPAAVARPAVPVHRRRLTLAVGATVLLALVLAAVVMAARGGRATHGRASPPATVPGDAVGAIGPTGAAIRAVVALGTAPSVLAAGDGAVWVADSNAGTVSRIDPSTRAVVETIPVGSSPSGIAVAPGAVWIADIYGNAVSRIDPAVDRVVQTIPVGNAPTGVAVGDGSVWVANSSDGTLTRIDAVTGDVVRTIALGAGATDVAVGAGAVWVSDQAGDRVYRVDPQADQVTADINVGTGPTALAVAFGSVWVANSLDGTVSRLDPQTNTVLATIPAGDGAGGIAVGDGGAWVTSPYAGTVERIDPVSDAVTQTVRVGNRPAGLALTGGLVWFGVQPAGTGHRGGTLRVQTEGYVDTFDPVLTSNLVQVLPLTYDGLTDYQYVGGSGSTQLVPDLAASLPAPTDGGTTYTFKLRRGIRFSDGELVRPEDFRRALERDLILGGNTLWGGPFANVVGGAACAAHPHHCNLSHGVVIDDAANTVTFHLIAPNPEFLQRLTLLDAVAVPADTPLHDIGLHPLPTTGPSEWVYVSRDAATEVRNPYFHEWSHAARPDGYPDRIVWQTNIKSDETALTAVERGTADYLFDGVPEDRMNEAQTRFARQLHITPMDSTGALILNTRVAPFTDVRVRRAINYAIDRAKIAALVGQDTQPACQILTVGLPGYRRYCPYTIDPNPAGAWQAPDLARAERLIAASGTRGTPITIWDIYDTTFGALDRYLVSLLDRLGYPTRVKDYGADAFASARFADSRNGAQAALYSIGTTPYPSAFQVLQVEYACRSFVPKSPGNPNLSEFCDHRLDAQINGALAAESNNSPQTAALWAQADRTATDDAPAVPLTTGTDIHLVSARVGNYQYSFPLGVLLDQLWVR